MKVALVYLVKTDAQLNDGKSVKVVSALAMPPWVSCAQTSPLSASAGLAVQYYENQRDQLQNCHGCGNTTARHHLYKYVRPRPQSASLSPLKWCYDLCYCKVVTQKLLRPITDCTLYRVLDLCFYCSAFVHRAFNIGSQNRPNSVFRL